uniref:Retrotransposon gag domain-containing protein n=1 Tax=Cannabis sativa TaxID=3483 RepID=A0A803PTC3_CANSA
MTYKPSYTNLASIKEDEGETLQDYFKRFNVEVTKGEKSLVSSLVCMLITIVLPRTDFLKELQARCPEKLVEFFAMAEPHKRIKNLLVELEKGKQKLSSPVPRTRSRSLQTKSSRGHSPSCSPKRCSPTRHRSPKLAKSPTRKESSLKRKRDFKQMGLHEKDLKLVTSSIYGITWDTIELKGMIKLPITLGTTPVTTKSMANFAVIDQHSAYNAVIEHPIVKEMKIVTSIYHLTMKFLTHTGVGSVRGVQSTRENAITPQSRS